MAGPDDAHAQGFRSGAPFTGTIAVFETMESAHRRARQAIQNLGYRLAVEASPDAIERRCLGENPPDVLIVSLPEGQDLVDRVRTVPRPPIIMGSLAGPPATARERFAAFDVPLYAVRPHSVETLGPLVHAAGMLARSRDRIQALRSAEDRLRERLHQAGHSGNITGFQHFEFFKTLLVLELKRAKRFGYSIAVCLVAPDPLVEKDGIRATEALRDKLTRKVAAAVTKSIRDIDIPVDYAEQRLLLFLPYTDSAGAKEVGERVLSIVRASVHTKERERQVRMTVSIGIAALGKGKEVSFARLIKDASTALKAAQLKGGNRMVNRDD
jgi:diguanylate cyclase (GGDEF)-like protein